MIRYLRKATTNKRIALTVAMAMYGLIGDLHAFADDAPAAQPRATAETAARAQADAAKLQAKGLVTVEEVYTGMLEAARLRASAARSDPAVDNAVMAEKWGVQVIGVSYAADGFWLAFRFRVIDPAKAVVLFDSKFKPYVESEANGVKLGVPTAAKIGALRTTNRGHNVKAGKIYNIMFSNPGFLVQPGQQVTVAAGEFRVEHLRVRGAHKSLSINRSSERIGE